MRLSLLSSWGLLAKKRLRIILLIAFAAALTFSVTMLLLYYLQSVKEEKVLKQLAVIAGNNMEHFDPTPGSTLVGTQAPENPVMLEQYGSLYKQNPDMVGWIKIDGTVIDYPVMYTSDDFYLSHGFDRAESKIGVPFIDKRCTVEPLGTNTIVYGHHMKNGTMFAGLENYKNRYYYKEHPRIHFDTLYEQQEYEIIAVFESQIYRKSDTVFKHYNFLNAEGQMDFDEYILNIKLLSIYDTGVTASYGDELLTLVTCDYHRENGQFVVVARKAG